MAEETVAKVEETVAIVVEDTVDATVVEVEQESVATVEETVEVTVTEVNTEDFVAADEVEFSEELASIIGEKAIATDSEQPVENIVSEAVVETDFVVE